MADSDPTAVPPRAVASVPTRIVKPGVNCWRTAQSARASVLVDAAEYFLHLERALRRAERSILIVGWDFDGSIRLSTEGNADSPRLGDLLRSLVDARPQLEVRILVWSLAVVHAPGATKPLLFGSKWQTHPRIRVKLDTKHPLYAAHHQKIVAVDDAIAFVGGMDLTTERWDTSSHAAGDGRRVTYAGKAYGPVHDVQMAVDGEAAVALAEVARERWQIATGETLAPRTGAVDLWPLGLHPHFCDEAVAIARTSPSFGGRSERREGARLTRDAIDAAERSIYIEAQYLTARYVRAALARSLAKEAGPEVVVVLNRAIGGVLERLIMGKNGDRLMRQLARQDAHGRLRVYHPVTPCADGTERRVLIHAKVVIVDDDFLRVGSSNLNNRSVGLDTECDIAIESRRPESRAAITRLRNTLLGEHVDATAEQVAAAIVAEGSLIRAVDSLNVKPRALRPYDAMDGVGPTHSIPGTWLLDPRAPIRLLGALGRRTAR